MNNNFLRYIQLCIFCLDVFCLNISIIAAAWWFNINLFDRSTNILNLWIWINIFWISLSWIINVYSLKRILSFELFSRKSMHVYLYWLAAVIAYLFVSGDTIISKWMLANVFFIFGISLFLNRWLMLIACYYLKRNNYLVKKVMIVGYNETAKKLVSYFEEDGMITQIVGFCEDQHKVHELSNYPILDSVDNSIKASLYYDVNEIYSTISPEQNSGIYQLIKEADNACIHFKIVPDLSFIIKESVYIDYLKDMPVLSLRHEPLTQVENRIKKRVFDIIFSLLVIIVILSWMLPLFALLIKLESKGPVFFKQLRTGRDKKIFHCLKFRSMKLNDESNTRQASKGDERITKMGRFLRKTNLDEFPQFLNVLWGNMSVVGPRPHMIKHTNDYSKLIDRYMIRQFLKPGITGWAQVNNLRGETKTLRQMQARVEHDIWYMEHWSQWLDIKIILMTIGAMVRGDQNAY